MPVLDVSTPLYSVGYLINRVYDMVLGTTREQLCTTNGDIGATDKTINLTNADLVTPGSVLSIDDELVYIFDVSTASAGFNATVYRGFRQTTPTPHLSGTLSQINPYFSKHEIRESARDEIRSWAPKVFSIRTVDITALNQVVGYDLGNINVLHSLACKISPNNADPLPLDNSWPDIPFDVNLAANTSVFPSGKSLTITAPGGIFDSMDPGSTSDPTTQSQTIHYIYATPFNVDLSFVDTTDLVDGVGVDESDIDIVIYGCAWRLTAGMEIRRNLLNPMQQSGNLQGVPPAAILHEADYYKQMRDDRLRDASNRLRGQYPVLRQ